LKNGPVTWQSAATESAIRVSANASGMGFIAPSVLIPRWEPHNDSG
jgi:hypothetical protein